jgi:hypothetical protein
MPDWVRARLEEKHDPQVDARTPVLPPFREGDPAPGCKGAPDEARILAALPDVPTGTPYCQEGRENIRIVTELIVDHLEAPRPFPLVGQARLHRCHWKCTVYYDETIESGYPFPFRCVRPRVQVVYLDLDHLHVCPDSGRKPADCDEHR